MSEMVDETMDMLDDDVEELDDEAEAEVDKVLFEITNGKMGDMSKVGTLPVRPPTCPLLLPTTDKRVLSRLHSRRKKRRKTRKSCGGSWTLC